MPSEPPCKDTHDLIRSGLCPWCRIPILDGLPRPDIPQRTVGVRQWDISAMEKALDDPDQQLDIAARLVVHSPDTEDALPLLRKALALPNSQARFVGIKSFFMHGSRLSSAQAEKFEKLLENQPEDSALHILLLCYHFLPATRSESAKHAHYRHLIWLIERVPELLMPHAPPFWLDPRIDRGVYDQARTLWLKNVERYENNATIFGNAAAFFERMGYFLPADGDMSESLLEKACALEPDSPEWPERLARFYGIRLHRALNESLPKETGLREKLELHRQLPDKVLSKLEAAYGLEQKDYSRLLLLPSLAKAALEAGDETKTKAYAAELLDQTKFSALYARMKGGSGVANHVAHLVLGMLSLRTGNVEDAKTHLFDSVNKFDTDSALRHSGPNTMLARELLILGQRDAVLQFLRLCAPMCQIPDHRLEKWIYEIEQGGFPDFGMSLFI